MSANCPDYAMAFHGIALAGGVVTTANPLYAVDELAHQLNDSAARFVITAPQFMESVRAAASGTRVAETFVFGAAPGATPFTALMESGEAPRWRCSWPTSRHHRASPRNQYRFRP